jgi:predicted phosphodiesterase
MPHKLLIVDDDISRKQLYTKVLKHQNFELHFAWTREDFNKYHNTPFDGYLLDVFLERGDWGEVNAVELIEDSIAKAPRSAPVFLISSLWGDERILDVLKQIGDSSAKVVQYLPWGEFEQATSNTDTSKQRTEALRKKITFELDRWHARTGFHPSPDDTIRLLILADIQYGDPATDPSAPFAEHRIARSLKEKGKRPDLILIAGDITLSGAPDQFQLAEERILKDLVGSLWGGNNIERNKERIIVVPGNHDVNLRFSECDNVKFNLDDKQLVQIEGEKHIAETTDRHSNYALEPFKRFAYNVTNDRRWIKDSHLSWVDRRFLNCGLCFFILNSVHALSSQDPKQASLSEKALRDITRSIEEADWNSSYNIAISHHGLRPAGKPTTETEISNWDSHTKEFLSLHKMDLWVYGHYHEYDTGCHKKREFQDNPLHTLQAPTAHITSKERSFCIVEIQRKDSVITDVVVEQYSMEKGSKLLDDENIFA